MLRKKMVEKNIGRTDSFQWRSHEITRIEGFSDAVFAFAVTLLVVSLEVPRTFSDLMETMSGFGAFACGFALLFLVWFNQYKFFRRFGLQDPVTLTLNGILLFVVLFFVYPLKFLFTVLIKAFTGQGTVVLLHDGSVVAPIVPDQWEPLMIIYGLGYIAIFGTFALLYFHAIRKDELHLTPVEMFLAKMSLRENLLQVGIGIISILIVTIGGAEMAGWSGMAYVLVGPAMALHGTLSGKALRKLESSTQS
ncbi:MAG: TMEM175 family protein [bacterium]